MYTKIVHNQLNTMTVNKKWNMGRNICPLCNSEKEDWLHVLKCTAPVPSIQRGLCLADFEDKMKLHRTYPPLGELFMKYWQTLVQYQNYRLLLTQTLSYYLKKPFNHNQ